MHSSLPSSSSAASSPPLPSAVADSPGHHRPPATAFMLEQQREMQTQLQHFVQGQLALQQLDERFASTQSAASFSVAAPGLFSPSSAQHSSSCPSREATEEQGGEPATGSTLLASAFLLDQAMASVALSPVPSANIGPPSVEEEEEAVKANGEEEQGREEVNDKNGKAEEQTGRTMRENGEEIAKEPEERDQNGDEVSPPPQNSDANEQQSERRTTELIRKQLAEIEREIARRMQNKNVKKMDEQEMSQLLLDHGFSIRLGQHHENGNGQQSALPFPSDGGSRPAAPVAPNLDQLRQSSLSGPPSSQAQQPMYFPQPFPSAQFAHPQGPFLTQICPQEQFAIPQPFVPAAQFYQFAPNAFSAPFLPQQNAMAQQTSAILHPTQSPSPPFAQMLPPSMSAITPEMAAALLAQLQQHNPALLQNLVDQQQCQTGEPTNSISATAPPAEKAVAASDVPSALPAPPRGPQCSIAGSRRELAGRRLSATNGGGTSNGGVVGHMRRQNSAEWTDEKRENNDNKAEPQQPVWLMRESFLKRKEREEQRRAENGVGRFLADEGGARGEEQEEETDKLLLGGAEGAGKVAERRGSSTTTAGEENGGGGGKATRKGSKKEVIIHEPAVLIEGVLFRARYLGSTQMSLDGRPTKSSRMAQAQEAVARVKAPEGELQPSTEIDLFISTEKIMVLNTDLQRISETDVRQDILMDHALRSISYIADIGDLVVLMARRVPNQQEQADEENEAVRKAPRVICHVFESDESAFIAQSIGQAFQVAYVEFLRANGIEDPNYLRDIDYQEVLNSQELLGEELELLARKETQKDVVVAKKSGEALGVVVVESGWGSMLPTVVIANMAPGGAAARSNQLNIGDQIIGINGISLVGLPLSAAQTNIKNARSSTAVRLTVVSTPPVVEVRIRRPDTKYQLGFSVQNGVICSLLRGGIAERGGIRVGHRIIEINHQSVVAVPHERIVNMLATATGEIHMKTMPTSMFRLLTGQEVPNYI